MVKRIFGRAALVAALALSVLGCRTLDVQATEVAVRDRVGDECTHLGHVNINWCWWCVSSEVLNVLRNQVAEQGGNTLVITTDYTGIAYDCPATSIVK